MKRRVCGVLPSAGITRSRTSTPPGTCTRSSRAPLSVCALSPTAPQPRRWSSPSRVVSPMDRSPTRPRVDRDSRGAARRGAWDYSSASTRLHRAVCHCSAARIRTWIIGTKIRGVALTPRRTGHEGRAHRGTSPRTDPDGPDTHVMLATWTAPTGGVRGGGTAVLCGAHALPTLGARSPQQGDRRSSTRPSGFVQGDRPRSLGVATVGMSDRCRLVQVVSTRQVVRRPVTLRGARGCRCSPDRRSAQCGGVTNRRAVSLNPCVACGPPVDRGANGTRRSRQRRGHEPIAVRRQPPSRPGRLQCRRVRPSRSGTSKPADQTGGARVGSMAEYVRRHGSPLGLRVIDDRPGEG